MSKYFVRILLSISIFILPHLSPAQAAISFFNNDPYVGSLSKPTHELQIRVIQHGLKGRDNLIAEQIRYAETALSQCPGVVVKITPIEYQKVKSSTNQEEMTTFKGSDIYYSKDFLNFAKPFALDRQNGPIDIHMTEFMNKEIRKTKKVTGQINYGQAFNMTSLNVIFKDPRSVSDQKIPLENLVGNSLYLAIETVALQRQTVTKYPQADSHPRSYSLMAHEIGHLLLEAYDPVAHFYGDHWCPAFNAPCEKGYLMSSGGNNDAYYTDKTSGKILGYDALPLLDNVQCERLRTSKYLKRL